MISLGMKNKMFECSATILNKDKLRGVPELKERKFFYKDSSRTLDKIVSENQPWDPQQVSKSIPKILGIMTPRV